MMTSSRNAVPAIRRAAVPALAFMFVLYFLGYAIMGANGVLAWGDYRRLKVERKVELARLNEEKVRLAHRADLLDPLKADPDLADEMVRKELGLVRPDEVVVPLDR
jgi:cell division protein FtsB